MSVIPAKAGIQASRTYRDARFFAFKLTALCLLGALLSVNSQAQEHSNWTLDASISSALSTSPRLAARSAQLDAALSDAGEARAARFGGFGASGGFTYTSEIMKLTMGIPPNPFFTPPVISFGDGKAYDFALIAQAPIYAGGALRNREEAALKGVDAAKFDAAAETLQVVYDVRRAWLAALSADNNLQIAQRRRDRLARHLEELEGAQRIGMATEEAHLQAEAALKMADAGIVVADADRHSARLALGNATGHPGEEIVPSGDIAAALIDSAAPTGIYTNRPELSAFASRLDQARRLSAATRSVFYPMLSAMAAYHYARPGIDPVKNEWMDFAVAGVNLSWTIWDFGPRARRYDKAQASLRTLEASRKALAEGLLTRQQTDQTQRTAAADAARLCTERVQLVIERYALVESRFHQGMATESETLDAEDDLHNAELDAANALVHLRLAECELLYSIGR